MGNILRVEKFLHADTFDISPGLGTLEEMFLEGIRQKLTMPEHYIPGGKQVKRGVVIRT